MKPTIFNSRDEWRAWLRKNHKTEKEIWLIFYKKHLHKNRLRTLTPLRKRFVLGGLTGSLGALTARGT